MNEMRTHPTYVSNSYVTVQDIHDAMQVKNRPCTAAKSSVKEGVKKDIGYMDMTNIVSYFDNKFYDLDEESPEFAEIMDKSAWPRKRDQKAGLKNKRYQTLVIVK